MEGVNSENIQQECEQNQYKQSNTNKKNFSKSIKSASEKLEDIMKSLENDKFGKKHKDGKQKATDYVASNNDDESDFEFRSLEDINLDEMYQKILDDNNIDELQENTNTNETNNNKSNKLLNNKKEISDKNKQKENIKETQKRKKDEEEEIIKVLMIFLSKINQLLKSDIRNIEMQKMFETLMILTLSINTIIQKLNAMIAMQNQISQNLISLGIINLIATISMQMSNLINVLVLNKTLNQISQKQSEIENIIAKESKNGLKNHDIIANSIKHLESLKLFELQLQNSLKQSQKNIDDISKIQDKAKEQIKNSNQHIDSIQNFNQKPFIDKPGGLSSEEILKALGNIKNVIIDAARLIKDNFLLLKQYISDFIGFRPAEGNIQNNHNNIQNNNHNNNIRGNNIQNNPQHQNNMHNVNQIQNFQHILQILQNNNPQNIIFQNQYNSKINANIPLNKQLANESQSATNKNIEIANRNNKNHNHEHNLNKVESHEHKHEHHCCGNPACSHNGGFQNNNVKINPNYQEQQANQKHINAVQNQQNQPIEHALMKNK